MRVIDYDTWIEDIKKLNEGQPSLLDLIQRQIDSYEKEKKEDNK